MASVRRLNGAPARADGAGSGEDAGSGAGARAALFEPLLEKLVAAKSLSGQDVRRYGGALKALQRGLTGDRRLAGVSYFSERDYLGAYLLYYWPVSFVQVFLALQELRMRGALPTLRNVLDIGAGPGPASFAAAEFGAERATLVDRSGDALGAARRLSAMRGFPISAVQRNLEEDGELPVGPYDLVVACHSANELWKGEVDAAARRTAQFLKAFALLAEGGVLLIVEPSANATGRPALELRNRLLAAGGNGMRCVAPCPGSGPCPMTAADGNRNCHSTWPWEPKGRVAELAGIAGLDRDSAKATWFALKKDAGPRPEASVPAAPETRGGSLSGRVVSEAMLNKAGRVRYIVCADTGLVAVSAKATDPSAREAGFFSLARGDLIEAEGLELRAEGAGLGFAPGSALRIALRAPEASGSPKPEARGSA